jgi:hypothetical protein
VSGHLDTDQVNAVARRQLLVGKTDHVNVIAATSKRFGVALHATISSVTGIGDD